MFGHMTKVTFFVIVAVTHALHEHCVFTLHCIHVSSAQTVFNSYPNGDRLKDRFTFFSFFLLFVFVFLFLNIGHI